MIAVHKVAGVLRAVAIGCLALCAQACGNSSNEHDASIDVVSADDAAMMTVDDADATSADDTTMTTVDPLPAFDDATTAHIADLVSAGQTRGNRRNVFAKLGDSITESRAFLYACGSGALSLGAHADLMDTVLYFREVTVDPDFNSLERPSLCATGGWTSGDAIEGGEQSPAAQELDLLHPQWALVMYGTNDLEHDADPGGFRTRMTTLLDLIEARSVVAVLSTIPPRLDDPMYGDRVAAYNDTIRDLAHTRHLPVIDFWLALQAAPNDGMDTDGIHPTANMTDGFYDACNLTDSGLAYGYDVRNWLSLAMLQRLTR